MEHNGRCPSVAFLLPATCKKTASVAVFDGGEYKRVTTPKLPARFEQRDVWEWGCPARGRELVCSWMSSSLHSECSPVVRRQHDFHWEVPPTKARPLV